MVAVLGSLATILEESEAELLARWIAALTAAGATRSGQMTENEIRDACGQFIRELRMASRNGAPNDLNAPEWTGTRSILEEVSSVRALKGYSPTETALFVFALKEPLFGMLREKFGRKDHLPDMLVDVGMLLDRLGLYTTEIYLKSREEVIRRQQTELLELSTPVVQLWSKILALPLIGTLDSARTQVVMENLLQSIVDTESEIAIIDITGVPTVDTLVAQHLLKTISAARLMGADCIISGIRPQIAQTIVHLGLDLNVVSKATMADAFALALRRTGQVIEHAAARG